MSEKMTIECVNQIKKVCSAISFHIIVVDNASLNGSGKNIFEKYAGDSHCTVLLNEENLGYAQGNNVGWSYAKEKLIPEYITVMNNDVLIKDPEFCTKVMRIYYEKRFDVLGPDIYAVKKDEHQNPMWLQLYSEEEVEKIIAERKRWLRYYPFHYYGNVVLEYAKRIVKQVIHIKQGKRRENLYYRERFIENPVLHGACLIFSKCFIRNEEYAFNPNTFLYFEEDLLYFQCREKGYRMLYSSDIQVEHLEDVSTDMVFSSDYAKLRMKYENIIKSASVLLELMKKETEIKKKCSD